MNERRLKEAWVASYGINSLQLGKSPGLLITCKKQSTDVAEAVNCRREAVCQADDSIVLDVIERVDDRYPAIRFPVAFERYLDLAVAEKSRKFFAPLDQQD